MSNSHKYTFGLDTNLPGHKRERKSKCPKCRQKTFVKYLDFKTLQYFGDEYGRCERVNSCGYHNIPQRQAAHDRRQANGYIRASIAQRTFAQYENNPLAQFLMSKYDPDEVYSSLAKLEVGTAKRYGGAAVFWLRDVQGRYRSGKVMGYDQDGKRKKGCQNWVHTLMDLDNFELNLCLYGEHNLPKFPELPVSIFESEKTAIIFDIVSGGQSVCLAAGSKDGLGGRSLNREKCKVLKGREVVLYPDTSEDGSTEAQWKSLAQQMNGEGIRAMCSQWFDTVRQEDRGKGLDIADVILNENIIPMDLLQHTDPDAAFYAPF